MPQFSLQIFQKRVHTYILCYLLLFDSRWHTGDASSALPQFSFPCAVLYTLRLLQIAFFPPSIYRYLLICFLLDIDFSFCLFTCILLPVSCCPFKHLCGWDGKESACNAGDSNLIPGLGGSPGEGNGNPLQYSCLENPKDREACQATVHGVAKSGTTEWLTLSLLVSSSK